MVSYNKVVLIGNLTRDPELRYTSDGRPVTSMRLAVNRRWRGGGEELKEEVCFVDVTCFGKDAENVAKFVKKGAPLLVDGRLHLEEWQSKDGDKRSKIAVVSERCGFLRRGAKPSQEDQDRDLTPDDEEPVRAARGGAGSRKNGGSRARPVHEAEAA
ncbi:MAG: single-stranded DNA-binding protein [Candidatus Riflebacteria bacterium]|nr:single-stranded DNA-binding protein [Candidatus Riflebacteria bacterium]